MALASRRWVFAVAAAAVTVFACNAIIGVEDVKLKGTGGIRLSNDSGEELPGDDEIVTRPRDSGPTEEEERPQLALGFSHTCARSLNGIVRCWGSNSWGQLGNGAEILDASAPNPPDQLRPTDVPGINDALGVAAGSNHTCVLHRTGKISCFGDNYYGTLGNGNTIDSSKPVPVADIDDAIAVAAGGNVSCAIRANKKAYCWGYNFRGGLGDGTTAHASKPVEVADVDDIVQIAPAGNHTCAVRGNGELWCWGGAIDGQLGTGSVVDTTKPARVTALTEVVQVAVANAYSCARVRSGRLHCWGRNTDGQLAAGAPSNDPSPSPISLVIDDAISLGAGSQHTCAVRKGGGVMCWGNGIFGQLGIGPVDGATNKSAAPVAVVGLTTAHAVWTGGARTCALTTDNKAMCWGRNFDGQLGDGSTEDKNVPSAVSDF